MYKILNEYDFIEEFFLCNLGDNFSRTGLLALYDFLEENKEDELGQALDVIALCCDFTEYETAYEAMQEYQPDDMPTVEEDGLDLVEIQEEQEKKALEWLEERTLVIPFEDGVIIQNF